MALEVIIDCSDEQHRVWIELDKPMMLDVNKHDVELELALGALGGEMSECVKLSQEWNEGGLERTMKGRWSEDFIAAFGAPNVLDLFMPDVDKAERREDFVTILLTVLQAQLQAEDEDAADTARMLLQHTDAKVDAQIKLSNYESEEDYDYTTTNAVTQTLVINDIEVAEWKHVYERRIWDPIFFESDVSDWCKEVGGKFCTPAAITDVLDVLGLEELDDGSKEDVDVDDGSKEDVDVSEPYVPSRPLESNKQGEYGVLYEPTDEYRWRVIAEYKDHSSAIEGMETSLSILQNHCNENEYEITIVKRLSDKDFDALVRRIEVERKTYSMFSKEVVPPLTDEDLKRLQWVPWTEKDEELFEAD